MKGLATNILFWIIVFFIAISFFIAIAVWSKGFSLDVLQAIINF